MRIAVIGTGYVGLVAGACFAETGVNVVCVDIDREKLERLERGIVPIFEPGLDQLVKHNCPERLTFTTNLEQAIAHRAVVFVAVGTPPNEDGSADLSHVLAVAEDVARKASGDLVLVLKSTVPVGTNQKVRALVEKVSRHRVSVVSNPEFLKEGDAVRDFLKPDRIVIGTDDDRAFELMSRLYAPFNRQRDRLHRMAPTSAEIVKYAANALLATKISFMNEISALCDAVGGDVEDVRVAIGADHRIGFEFLYPGLGFGGSCFPKDLRALVHTGEQAGVALRVASAAIEANRHPVSAMLGHIQHDLGDLTGKRIAVWGLAFKPKTDDVREAPALALIEKLLEAKASVVATDPEAIDTARTEMAARGIVDQVELVTDPYDACRGADALVVATEWTQFRSPDPALLRDLMRGRHVFDGRNVLVEDELLEAGFHYRGLGRGIKQAR